ncbi:chorismate synthase [Caminibacter mediatlanticus TB-2]|uniref:Chorismate synthase n=1 Tax=Caminibacter mediatlanticus TB-2 TaxID=391592 RepID=A0ABX5V7X2_9BACT|nr:chorismate synthase [Caminibacter mediatlanticus]QCT93719.1 chorismate synthase [Caminibacter mediatlanticus TB-2]
MFNSFGEIFRFTTFGESHGRAIGVVVDGVPAGIEFDEEFLKNELARRKPGKNRFSTQRKEDDLPEVLSGIFEGKTTGTPIGVVIFNKDQKSKDYSNIKDIFRPGHADFTYFHKYSIRDYRGGGRSSARETAARVVAGAIAKMILKELNIEIEAGVIEIGGVRAKNEDFEYAKKSEIFALDKEKEKEWIELIDKAREEHNSLGGVVKLRIKNLPIGLGEPIYYKLDNVLASAIMSINAVKGIYIGNPNAHKLTGVENNDEISKNGFLSNNAGGVLGGISNGENIEIEVYFKPTPSIFKPQKSIDINGNEVEVNLKGRHDPIVAIRGSVVVESMAACVIADMLMLNMTRTIENIKKIYQ